MQKYIKHVVKVSLIILSSPLLLVGFIAYTIAGFIKTGFDMGDGIWDMITDWTNND
jgi:hypothetical protein